MFIAESKVFTIFNTQKLLTWVVSGQMPHDNKPQVKKHRLHSHPHKPIVGSHLRSGSRYLLLGDEWQELRSWNSYVYYELTNKSEIVKICFWQLNSNCKVVIWFRWSYFNAGSRKLRWRTITFDAHENSWWSCKTLVLHFTIIFWYFDIAEHQHKYNI